MGFDEQLTGVCFYLNPWIQSLIYVLICQADGLHPVYVRTIIRAYYYWCCSHIKSHNNHVRGHRTGSRHSGAEEYPREKHKQPNVVHAYIPQLTQFMPPPETYTKSEIGSQSTMCQVHTGAYASLLTPGKTDSIPLATQERLPRIVYTIINTCVCCCSASCLPLLLLLKLLPLVLLINYYCSYYPTTSLDFVRMILKSINFFVLLLQ